MADKSKVALALVLGGIVCVLASLGGIMYLYHEHAATFSIPPVRQSDFNNFEMFLFCAGIPAGVGFIIGVTLVAIGIKMRVDSN